jgi:hypothetical protein
VPSKSDERSSTCESSRSNIDVVWELTLNRTKQAHVVMDTYLFPKTYPKFNTNTYPTKLLEPKRGYKRTDKPALHAL